MLIPENKLTIVSRKSRLALVQAAIVQQELLNLYPQLSINILGISTSGDEILDQPLNKIGGKGLFVSELENFLLTGNADMAVHSMKDVPAELANGLALGAIMQRANPCDVFVSDRYSSLQQLPAGAVVGTSSLRRQAQVLAIRSDLTITPLRGNVETRLQKLTSGEYAAIILAAAGLERLGLTQWLNKPLNVTEMLPAVGQGALGIEYNADRADIKKLLAPLNHPSSAACVLAERTMNAKLDGGCQAPIAGFATIDGTILTLQGLVANPNGKTIFKAAYSGSIQDANLIGTTVADQLLKQGAGSIISELKNMWKKDAW
jgi:hydroxymethylbilane synthase